MKLLRYALLLLALVGGRLPHASAQVFEWAKLARNLGQPFGYSQAATTDLVGNTYVSVRFRDSVRVGTQRFSASGYNDLLVKYDSAGHVAWAKVMRGLLFDQGGLRVNPATGDLFMSGRLLAGATWDGNPVPGGGANTYFYAQCSPAGTLRWANLRPFLARPVLAADDQGNCYLLGQSLASGTWSGFVVDSASFVLFKANGAGTPQWLNKLQGSRPPGTPGFGTGLGFSQGLGVRPGGGVLVFGQFYNALYYGTSTTPVQTNPLPVSTPVNFLASVDASGSLQWSRPTPGVVTAATADASGSYYIAGVFPPATLPQPGFDSNGLLAKFNSAGTQQWMRTLESSSSPAPTSFAGRLVAVDGAGGVTIVADGSVQPGISVKVGTLPLKARSNVVHFNAQGQEQWVANDWQPGHASAPFSYVDAVGLGLDARGNVYYTADISGDSLRRAPVVQLGANTTVGSGVIVSRIGTRHNTIAGRLYLDQNGNGVRDAGEGPFPIPLVVAAAQTTHNSAATPSATGDYRLYADVGSYTATVPQVPAHYAISQPGSGSYSGSFGSFGRLDSARHIGIRPLANLTDLRVTLTPYGAARPGFTTRYRLTLENVGTTTVASGTATVTLDARMLYVSSTPAATVSGRVLSWNYAALAPFARREFDVLFSLPTNAPLGAVLNTTAAALLGSDVTPDDNTATAAQTITGSFDPNDIEVNYTRLTPTQVAARLPLDYTVRFQNMGTDTAFTVVISDTLDFRKLNPATLMLVAQSHNCMWSLSGTGLLTVRFLNIQLPHRNQDVIRSQGFVRFRVQPRPTLALGEVIPNHAGIVFDFNAPVITNTATTTVFLATAALARHEATAWAAYPNPATDAVTLAADLATAGLVRIELLDVLGRPVRRQNLTAPAGPLRQTLDLRDLAAGVYVLRLTPPTGPATSRRVVRE